MRCGTTPNAKHGLGIPLESGSESENLRQSTPKIVFCGIFIICEASHLLCACWAVSHLYVLVPLTAIRRCAHAACSMRCIHYAHLTLKTF